MEVRLYVSNLDDSTTEGTLRQMFSQWGAVSSVKLIKDGTNGRSKGFACVTMATAGAAQRAIAGSHAESLAGRRLTVKIAEQSKPIASEGYQSKLGAFGATARRPKVNPPTHNKGGGGYQSKLGAFGNNSPAPTPPRRRGRDQRH